MLTLSQISKLLRAIYDLRLAGSFDDAMKVIQQLADTFGMGAVGTYSSQMVASAKAGNWLDFFDEEAMLQREVVKMLRTQFTVTPPPTDDAEPVKFGAAEDAFGNFVVQMEQKADGSFAAVEGEDPETTALEAATAPPEAIPAFLLPLIFDGLKMLFDAWKRKHAA